MMGRARVPFFQASGAAYASSEVRIRWPIHAKGRTLAGAAFSVWQAVPFVLPGGEAVLFLATAVMAGVGAYACLMKAMRTGDVSAVTPFRYTRLLFGIALGIVFFGETLSLSMIAGSILILMSGLFILWRGRRAGS